MYLTDVTYLSVHCDYWIVTLIILNDGCVVTMSISPPQYVKWSTYLGVTVQSISQFFSLTGVL